jgi:hypothetical protein
MRRFGWLGLLGLFVMQGASCSSASNVGTDASSAADAMSSGDAADATNTVEAGDATGSADATDSADARGAGRDATDAGGANDSGGDATNPGDATASDGPLACKGAYDELTAMCPATYDGTKPLPCMASSSPFFSTVWAQKCGGDLISVTYSNPIVYRVCFYDQTTNALVGALYSTDTNSYCGGTSNNQSAGRVALCLEAPKTATRSCP